MPLTAVIGAQWGDEGKGKIVDILSESADLVARFQAALTPVIQFRLAQKKPFCIKFPAGYCDRKRIASLATEWLSIRLVSRMK